MGAFIINLREYLLYSLYKAPRNLTRSHLLVVDYASSLRVVLDETKSYASDY